MTGPLIPGLAYVLVEPLVELAPEQKGSSTIQDRNMRVECMGSFLVPDRWVASLLQPELIGTKARYRLWGHHLQIWLMVDAGVLFQPTCQNLVRWM